MGTNSSDVPLLGQRAISCGIKEMADRPNEAREKLEPPSIMSRASRFKWLWGALLLLVWCAFVWRTYEAGFHPGFTHGRKYPYPWVDVFRTCGIMAIEIGLLYALIGPAKFRPNRAWVSLAVFAVLWFWEGTYFLVSDHPGWYYVNFEFLSFVAFGTLIIAILTTAAGIYRRYLAKS